MEDITYKHYLLTWFDHHFAITQVYTYNRERN